ncbi:MAG TPA: hypothetical protein VF606_12765 [Geminicoccaceae bacterium]
MAHEDRAPAVGAGEKAARSFDAATLSSWTQTLAIVAAGAWAVYTFIYEARIKPGLAPPAVSVTTSLVKAGERGERVAIRSTVTRTNVGQAGVRVLGLTYNVVGLKARFEPARAEPAAAPSSTIEEARGYALSDPGTVILRQGVLFAGATDLPAAPSDLNPGEAVSRDLIFYADRTSFDSVRVKVSLAYAKDSEDPVRLRFESGTAGEIAVVTQADCRADPAACARLKTTDFATEFSLW